MEAVAVDLVVTVDVRVLLRLRRAACLFLSACGGESACWVKLYLTFVAAAASVCRSAC